MELVFYADAYVWAASLDFVILCIVLSGSLPFAYCLTVVNVVCRLLQTGDVIVIQADGINITQ